MKVRIKEVPEGWFDEPINQYISVGKEYDFTPSKISKGAFGEIVGDNGEELYIEINGDIHLGGGSWEIIHDEVTP